MEWINEIEAFTPSCIQEIADKAFILNWVKEHPVSSLLRKNKVAHLSSSALILNEERTKTLMVFHNIYNTWSWTGGHVDGDHRFLDVAKKEAREETGIQQLTPLSKEIISLDVLPVIGHVKNGEYVSAHLHLSIAYAFVAPENQVLQSEPSENKDVKWISITELNSYSNEPNMVKVYEKMIAKANLL